MAIYSPLAGAVQGNLTVNPNQVNSSNKGGVSSQPVQPPANGATVSQPSMFGQLNQGGGMQQPMVAATGLNNQPMVVNGAQQPVQQPVQQPMQQPMQQPTQQSPMKNQRTTTTANIIPGSHQSRGSQADSQY